MYDLTICVITRNRAQQLKDAITSCLRCSLPLKTQFVIVDNASTDNTESVIHSILKDSGYNYIYKKLENNLGVGGGRNICFQLSCSKYSYYLDDDAIIDPSYYNTFFKLPIEIFNSYNCVATITTKIKDKAWGRDRDAILARSWHVNAYPCILMYHGGSHFIRNEVFSNRISLYDNIQYGHEELSPSLFAMKKGYKNIYLEEIAIIHCPVIDKWSKNSSYLSNISFQSINNKYLTNTTIYPSVFKPIIYCAYKARVHKHLKCENYSRNKTSKQSIRNTSKLDFILIVKLFYQFGFSVF